MSQWQCDAEGPRRAEERDCYAEQFPFTTTIRAIDKKEGRDTLMNYLYVASMALAEKFGITLGAAMDFLDWRMQTEIKLTEAVYGVKRCDSEHDGTRGRTTETVHRRE